MSVIGGINLGNLTDYLLFYSDGSTDANWQGASKGFVGDVAVDGIQASERTSGTVPYAGTIYTNDATLGAWQGIVDDNVGQASGSTGEVALITALESDLVSAFQQINALPATPGYESVSSTSLDGLNTQNGINEVFVINITSGLNFSTKINITGDPGDVFILRWDTDGDPTNGYQGQVKPQSGGAIVPLGGLTPANFINVAGDINASGGGSNPAPPYPQGPRYDDGQGALITGGSDFNGGGFFTGYWLTTGSPDIFDPGTGLYYGETSPLSNGIFVGGWYSITTKFSMTSGTSGVYVSPNESTFPSLSVEKDVSPDSGITWYPADSPPGPDVLSSSFPRFRFTVTNTGNVTLTNVQVTDDVYGLIGTTASLAPGASAQFIFDGTWLLGQQVNTVTASGDAGGETFSDTNPAYWVGVEAPTPSIDVEKEVSPDNGTTWLDADTPPGPNVVSGTNPQFRFTVTNTGNVTLTNVTVTDDVYGVVIGPIPSLAPGASVSTIVVGVWAPGQQVNTAIASSNEGATDTDPAYWFGVEEPAPAIDVEKEVSPDNGATWFDADIPPGPFVPQGTNPQFRFTVTNTGNITLTNVTVNDNVFGLVIGPIPSLAPGASVSTIVVGVWASGQQVNTAVASSNEGVTDTDPAYWFGEEEPAPAIDVGKEVSNDSGTTWFDADTPTGPFVPNGTDPWFRFTVTNTGQVPLTNVQVTDNVYGLIGTVAVLAPGDSASWIIIGTWASGQQVNTVTATSNEGVSATDPAYWFGVSPSIAIEKFVSVDNGVTWLEADTPPGPLLPEGVTPQFKIVVTNTGDVTLTNIEVTDSVFGNIGTLASLNPGVSNEWILS